MALRTSLVAQPHLYMGDTKGRPLDAGKIYFGEPNKDPEFYPINVFYDEALTVAAPQPIRTMGGFLNANGQMTEVYALESEYSVKVLDSYNRLVFYQPIMSSLNQSSSVSFKIPFHGSIERTLQDKNSEVVTAADFGDNLYLAGEWLKTNRDMFCYLEAGKVYVMPDGNNYCNRMLCKDGTATIICNENANLYYSHGAANILHLEGIDFVRYGRRTSNNSPSTIPHYSDGSAIVTYATLKNITYTTPSIFGDLSSWVDDTGKTRGGLFISYQVINDSVIENIKTYGAYFFATIRAGSEMATHREENCCFYNCETGIYLTGTFYDGYSENIAIKNTPLNKTYYRDSVNDLEPNGCDAILSESTHTSRYSVKNIFTENAIERSLYLISDNLYLSDIHSKSCHDGANIKHDAVVESGATASYQLTANNLSLIYGAKTLGGFRCNGYKHATWSNIKTISDTKTQAYGITSSGADTLVISNMYAEKIGAAVEVTGIIKELSISDSNFIDCGYATFSPVTINNKLATKCGKITINNVKSVTSDIKNPDQVVSDYGYSGGHAAETIIRDCVFHGKKYPFYTAGVDTIHIHNTLFEFASSDTSFTFWSTMFGKLSGTQADIRATSFDFIVRHHSTAIGIQGTTDVRFKRAFGENTQPIVDFWHSAEIAIAINSASYGKASNLFAPLSTSAVPSIWKVKARLYGSFIEFTANNIQKQMTDIVIHGDLFASSTSASKIALSYFHSIAGNYSSIIVEIPEGFTEIGTLLVSYERLS